MTSPAGSFRHRLKQQELLVGTFIKTPSPIICELLALSELDLVCLDTEHGPFGPLEIDASTAVLRAAGKPSLVRVADASATHIRVPLDAGASGILVPHVTSDDGAAAAVRHAHFGETGRGYAGSTRAADFGLRTMGDHLRKSREETTVIVQIEDTAALDAVADIAAVSGVDGIFVGRADLAVCMGKAVTDPAVTDAVASICTAAAEAGTAVGMFTPDLDEIPSWRDLGASFFLLSSDQSLMLAGANELARSVRQRKP